jgi:SAM-dependent methyltransferase
MAEHVYLQKGAVELYERTHGFYDHEGNNTKMAKLCSDVNGFILNELVQNESVTLLDLGVGRGDWVFLPLALKLIAKNKLDFAVGIDNSLEMLNYLKGSLSRNDYTELDWTGEEISSPHCKIIVVNKDIEELVYKWSPSKGFQRFDLLILMGSLHHLINWRQTINVITNAFLKHGGLVLIFERNADGYFVDGNFYKHLIDNKWKDLWSSYYRERATKGAPWEPEIRISDYGPLIHTLLDKGFTLKQTFEDSWEVFYTREEISSWLANPVFSNFFRSLDTSIIEELKNIPEEEDKKDRIFPITVNEGWKFFLFQEGSH